MGFKDIIKAMTFGDKVLILLLSVITVLSFYYVKVIFPEGAEASIEIEGKARGSYLLAEDRMIEINGSLGTAKIEIKGGKIRVIRAPCRDKICMKEGWISKAGESLICLPNKVMVYITGEARYDAISW
ncbi:MAG: NusG domain II-containing protein [Nitrospirota bacterium]